MNALKKMTQIAAMTAGVTPALSGAPSPLSGGLSKQYFIDPTQEYAKEYGYIASNFFTGQIQGLQSEDFYAYTPIKLRSSNVIQGNTGDTMPDDWQKIYIVSPQITTYIPPGAMVEYAGNTWVVFKSRGMGAEIAHALVRRCNAVINTLDYYGNVVGVPMSFAKMSTLGNANRSTEYGLLAQDYISCICQKNSISADFADNTRMILGKAAYSIRGLNDFTQAITDDPDTENLLFFTIERTEPMEQDNMDLGVANYGAFSWEINPSGAPFMAPQTQQQMVVSSIRNGQTVESTTQHPIEYTFSSTNDEVATVDSNGVIGAVSGGNAEIIVALKQNPNITATFPVTVAQIGTEIAFTRAVPAVLREMESVTVSAVIYQNGEATQTPVSFTFLGAANSAYAADVNGNSVTITCYAANPIPLGITAAGDGLSLTAQIQLTN